MDDIMVSVICLAYNHEKYIEQCLDGIIMQHTDYTYEILVHDDASTDNTVNIIKKYEQKFPNLIKGIYQVTNQYKMGINIVDKYLYPKSTGKYIAFCEGDDYWVDPYKLQKQINFMESHKDCTLCFTNGHYLREDKICNEIIPVPGRGKFYKKDEDYSAGDMILLDYVPTASLVFPKWVLDFRPQLRSSSFSGDTFLRISATYCGYAHFINDNTCIYRQMVPGSVTAQWSTNSESIKNATLRLLSLMEDLDSHMNYQYHTEIEYNKMILEYNMLSANDDIKSLRKKQYNKYAFSCGFRHYIRYLLRVYCPFIYYYIKSFRR